MKYHVIWENYDGGCQVNCFVDERDAEEFVVGILQKQQLKEDGTYLNSIIKGDCVGFDMIDVTAKVKFK